MPNDQPFPPIPSNKFNSAAEACSISVDASSAMRADTDASMHSLSVKVWDHLAQVRMKYGQGALDILGDQLDLQDTKMRISLNYKSPSIAVCPGVSDDCLPAVSVGRDENHHVTQITFMDYDYPGKDTSGPTGKLVWDNWK